MKNSLVLFKIPFLQSIYTSVILLNIGIWVRNFSILMFVMEQTDNDPFAVSMISVAQFGPMFLFSFIGGTLVDRWKPKKTMVICDLISSLFVALIVMTLSLGVWQVIFFVTLASSIFSQFTNPSAMKLYKIHVEEDQLQSALSLYQAIQSLFMILGPALGAYVFTSVGIYPSLLITSAAFLLSALALSTIPKDEEVINSDASKKGILKSMKAGYKYVIAKRELKVMGGCYVFAGLAVGLIQPLAVFIILEKLSLPREHVKYLMMASGIATLFGSFFVMFLRNKLTPPQQLALGMFVDALCLIVIGNSEFLVLTFAAQIVYGLFQPMIHIGINTIMVRTSEQEYLGRVNGFLNPLFMGTMLLMMSCAGWFKEIFTISTIYSTSGLLFLIGMLIVVPLFKLNFSAAKETEKAVQ
ncbi:MFS transporter [Cytobacillus pseudoceanisediminis]|uniref:MFS transporter n=1 Tax=Cytobacillus pseudoceanisediminis TaxID=3051614 RepID=A0ABZ2ZM56_9BACI